MAKETVPQNERVYYEVKLWPEHLVILQKVIEKRYVRADEMAALKQRIEARVERVPAELPWDALASEAKRQGASEADIFFDWAGKETRHE